MNLFGFGGGDAESEKKEEVPKSSTNSVQNPFRKLIFEAKKKDKVLERIKLLSEADQIFRAKPDVKYLSEVALNEINDMIHADADPRLLMILGQLLKRMCQYDICDKMTDQINKLIHIVNMSFDIHERLIGTKLSDDLLDNGRGVIRHLKEREGDLTEDQREAIDQVSESSYLTGSDVYKNFYVHLNKMKAVLSSNNGKDKLKAIESLIDILGRTFNMREQYELVAESCKGALQMWKTNISEENSKQLYMAILNFFTLLIFPSNFTINLEVDANKNPIHQKHFYLTQEMAILEACPHVFDTIATLLPSILLCKGPNKVDLQMQCFTLLKRAYYHLPSKRDTIQDYLLETLRNVDGLVSEPTHARLIYQFLQHEVSSDGISPEFKEKLLVFAKKYAVPLEKSGETVDPVLELESALNLGPDVFSRCRPGFPFSVTIQPGFDFYQYVEVEHPNSIACLGFSVQSYDIEFSLVRLRTYRSDSEEEESVEIIPTMLLDEETKTYVTSLILKEPGIYKLTWSNAYSIFREKIIKYKVSVLTPQEFLGQPSTFQKLCSPPTASTQKLASGLSDATTVTKEPDADTIFSPDGVVAIGAQIRPREVIFQVDHEKKLHQQSIVFDEVLEEEIFNRMLDNFISAVFGSLEKLHELTKNIRLAISYSKYIKRNNRPVSDHDDISVAQLGWSPQHLTSLSDFAQRKIIVVQDSDAAVMHFSRFDENLKHNGNLLAIVLDDHVRSSCILNRVLSVAEKSRLNGDISDMRFISANGPVLVQDSWRDPEVLSQTVANILRFLGAAQVHISGDYPEIESLAKQVKSNLTNLLEPALLKNCNIEFQGKGTDFMIDITHSLAILRLQ